MGISEWKLIFSKPYHLIFESNFGLLQLVMVRQSLALKLTNFAYVCVGVG